LQGNGPVQPQITLRGCMDCQACRAFAKVVLG
jgi:hypothetical protein